MLLSLKLMVAGDPSEPIAVVEPEHGADIQPVPFQEIVLAAAVLGPVVPDTASNAAAEESKIFLFTNASVGRQNYHEVAAAPLSRTVMRRCDRLVKVT